MDLVITGSGWLFGLSNRHRMLFFAILSHCSIRSRTALSAKSAAAFRSFAHAACTTRHAMHRVPKQGGNLPQIGDRSVERGRQAAKADRFDARDTAPGRPVCVFSPPLSRPPDCRRRPDLGVLTRCCPAILTKVARNKLMTRAAASASGERSPCNDPAALHQNST